LRRVVLLLVLFLLIAGDSAAVIVTRVELGGKLVFSGQEFSLVLECQHRDGEPSTRLYGHSTSSAPCVIKTYELWIGGQQVTIPASAYEDIANPNFLADFGITEWNGDLQIHLSGGDGENAYSCTFEFVDEGLLSRSVETIDAEGERRKETMRFPSAGTGDGS